LWHEKEWADEDFASCSSSHADADAEASSSLDENTAPEDFLQQ
jgi:hypothetical protein